jgi:hypothetical protein
MKFCVKFLGGIMIQLKHNVFITSVDSLPIGFGNGNGFAKSELLRTLE